MGSHSGHDGDKWEACGLHPYPVDGTCGVAEADVILVCRKMLQTKLDDKTFLDPSMENAGTMERKQEISTPCTSVRSKRYW